MLPATEIEPVGTLYYFGDPMCSWCWGFRPVLEQVEQEYPELNRVTVMGGLRRGPDVPMDDALIELIRDAWRRIAETTGQPFDHTLWKRHRPLSTTLPACRAVLTARILNPELEWPFMVAMFKAYFTEARDCTRVETHLEIAQEVGIDPASFSETLSTSDVERALSEDLRLGDSLGIRGYPTLMLKLAGEYHLVSPGYGPIEHFRRAINAVYESNGIEFTRPESGIYS